MNKIKILYIGDSWLGSCARSLKEAFRRNENVILDEVNIDLHITKPKSKILKLINKIFKKFYLNEFYNEILFKVNIFEPDFIVVYKGSPIEAYFLENLKILNNKLINIYPDYSPLVYGKHHIKALDEYNLVISTKVYHPKLWNTKYQFKNNCVFIPQGFDPNLHLINSPSNDYKFDVVLISTWRKEYHDLMKDLAKVLNNSNIKIAIGGNGWENYKNDFPSHWKYMGAVHGQGYTNLLRSGKICIAPINEFVNIKGEKHQGDVDTTRTYELAAANCFFIHKKTDYVSKVYDDNTEVPKYENAKDLAEKIKYYLKNDNERLEMTKNAHKKAVENYSLDSRVLEILEIIKTLENNNRIK